MHAVLFACVMLLCFVKISADGDWNYDNDSPQGPAHWPDHYKACGGENQSPVNIIRKATVTFKPPRFKFRNYNRKGAYTILNNGHSAQVSVNTKDITLSGGGLNGTYILEQFHFHWGVDSSSGSEHLIDSSSRQLEIHFVHYNSRYASVASAVASGDRQALAVVTVFAEESPVRPASAELKLIADNLVNISYKDSVATLSPLSVSGLLSWSVSGEFYRYGGSLTTPGCAEVVVWTVFKQGVYIRPDKLALFRKLHSSSVGELPVKLLTHNYRPTQPLHNRVILTGCNSRADKCKLFDSRPTL